VAKAASGMASMKAMAASAQHNGESVWRKKINVERKSRSSKENNENVWRKQAEKKNNNMNGVNNHVSCMAKSVMAA